MTCNVAYITWSNESSGELGPREEHELEDRETGSADKRRGDRHRAILDAAEHLFVEHGVSQVSLHAVVRRSGGSLATLYAMFGNKEGLLRAVVERNKDEQLGDWIGEFSEDESATEVLLRIARRFYAFITSRRSVAMIRIVAQQSLENPEFGQSFYRTAHEAALQALERVFRTWNEAGKASFDDPQAASALFLATVSCDMHMKALLGVEPDDRTCGGLEWRLQPFLAYFGLLEETAMTVPSNDDPVRC